MAAALILHIFGGVRGAAAANRRPSLFQEARPQELLIRFKDGCCTAERERAIDRLGLERKRSACRGTVEVVCTAPGQATSDVVRLLSHDANVLYAEPNQDAWALDLPDD